MRNLLVCLALAAVPPSPKPPDSELTVTSGAVELRSLSLLGVDVERGLLGVKVVATAKPYKEQNGGGTGEDLVEPVNCRYAGMKKTPFDGVTLALLHAGADDTGVWRIYEPTHTKCTAAAVSKERLAQAKAAFARVNMLMDKELLPTATPDSKGRMTLKEGTRTVVIQTVEEDEACDAEAPPEGVKALRCDPVEDRVRTLRFLADGKPLHESVFIYTGAYGGSARVQVLGAFMRGSKVLLLQQITTEVGMKGPSESTTDLRLSPVLELAR